MNVTVEQLIKCLDEATIYTNVLVRSSDWHNEAGWTDADIMYVCPVALRDALKELDKKQNTVK